jgi:hypothetical protein
MLIKSIYLMGIRSRRAKERHEGGRGFVAELAMGSHAGCAGYLRLCVRIWIKERWKIILSHIKRIPYGSGTCRGSEAARQRSFSFAVKRVDIGVFDNVAKQFCEFAISAIPR